MIHHKKKTFLSPVKAVSAVIFLMVVIFLFYFFGLKGKTVTKEEVRQFPENVYPTTATYSGTFSNSLVVEYKEGGFVPKTIKIKSGTKITFMNAGTREMWIASDPHPVHTGLKGFDQLKSTPKGGKYLYLFNNIGNFSYHNHVVPEDTGLIIVEK